MQNRLAQAMWALSKADVMFNETTEQASTRRITGTGVMMRHGARGMAHGA
jgi:hypothetical protein